MADQIRLDTDELMTIACSLVRLSGEVEGLNAQLRCLYMQLPSGAGELVLLDLLQMGRQLLDASQRMEQLARLVRDGADNIDYCEGMLRSGFMETEQILPPRTLLYDAAAF